MDTEAICCPKFDPAPWQETQHVWKERLFVKGYVTQFLHIPLNMGAVITKITDAISQAKAETKPDDYLMLAYDPSPWKSELYVTVSHEVPNFENVRLSGTFISKVFDGSFNAIPKWIKEFDGYLAKNNKQFLRYYFYYTTCPKCAAKYGHNYVVIFAQIA